MLLVPSAWVNVHSGEVVDSLPDGEPLAIAGIGDPKRFFKTLSSMGISCKSCIGFPDHHAFSKQDIPDSMVLMTEKDAVKCRSFAHQNCWYLRVNGNISDNLYRLIDEKLAILKQIKNK
jgi:tetraacyldisaccharide 4'-kinase